MVKSERKTSRSMTGAILKCHLRVARILLVLAQIAQRIPSLVSHCYSADTRVIMCPAVKSWVASTIDGIVHVVDSEVSLEVVLIGE